MKLSWSHKLFLRVNESVGEHPKLDSFMIFSAKWLIYFVSIFSVLWVMFNFQGRDILNTVIKSSVSVGVLYGVSLIIAVIVRKPRPEIELPQIKRLVHTIGIWKSFPSDHTGVSFLLVFLLLIFGLSIYLGLFLFIIASIIAVSRVYVGVHYPRDILGGFVLALFISFLYLVFI